ncbi:TerD family protein (plasmid) [Pseudomonas amygdali pv. lachrymans str. M301315]|uniref:Protein involved in tellurite resistance n=3 Tax=Pseudomonas amygdali TaxID=47877 RepID=A0ABR5KSE6_PSEAV|nr:TerD family protein [Pseudomonas amygdali pv. lachrymans str. M301315]KPC17735.1 Protein involved in tellurite resistance [Pseudomonas amygdali pv. lachrymans]RMT08673.1 Protein involved in tellurite resistance [Pseudomonas amygdali pv. lachrymans]
MAAISLKKGEKISLQKVDPGVKNLLIGLGWKERCDTGDDFDLDASVFLLNDQGIVEEGRDFVFYNPRHRKSLCGSVRHLGDNKKGGTGASDCEQIEIDLETLPARIDKAVVAITIYESKKRRQTFGMVEDAYARVVNRDFDREIARFSLQEEYKQEDSLIMIEVYRHSGEWRVGSVGQGFINGLYGLAKNYGLDVDPE